MDRMYIFILLRVAMNMDSDGSADSDTREEIMDATYNVLAEYGYAELSMRRIADELGKSKSLLHYHYDTKDDLLLAFLDRFLDQLDEWVQDIEADSHHERLLTFVDQWTVDPEEQDRQEFWAAFLELRLRAPYDPEFQKRLTTTNEAVIETLAAIIEDGITAGEFRDVDAYRVAETIISALEGARTRQATLERTEAPRRVEQTIEEFIIDQLILTEPLKQDQ